MEIFSHFADVLLPLPVSGPYTYGIPLPLLTSVITGGRVVVQFGKRKIYTALVLKIHKIPPGEYAPKPIISVLDDQPIVNEKQLRFWKWIAEYYMCHEGEVMNAALPSALKLASESRIILNPVSETDPASLNERELLLFETLLNRKRIEVAEASRILDQQKIIPLIKTMLEKGIILMDEELSDKYKVKTVTFVELTDDYQQNEIKFKPLFDSLEKKAKKQLDVVMSFLVLSKFGSGATEPVTKSALLKNSGASPAALDGLVKKNVFRITEQKQDWGEKNDPGLSAGAIQLTTSQETGLEQIHKAFEEKDIVLLHGVTSSGKTELYMKCIQEVIDRGQQVLFLLPEIALTTQIVTRLKKYFGSRIGVYHSRFNENERVEVWNKVLKAGRNNENQPFDIVLGARSAIFLPFADLGLVIVDEEHDSSYKQYDPAPRYHARDSALYLAHLHGAKAILGSATPSVESYFNTRQGKYALVELNERYGNMELPEVEVVDIRSEMHRKKMQSHFSSVLIRQIESALENHEQSIIFQNRRGFSLRLECDACNWMPSCKNCDVTLVYHKAKDMLICHYCGYTTQIPAICPSCRGTSLKMKGFGTEKVEEDLSIIFPKARIERMDMDTTRSRFAHQKIIDDLEQNRIDILVGTQMVTKGLDFENVSTVSILNADNMITFPDFRATERSYQLMAQVSGRSGRKNKRGKVIIQAYNTKHPVIQQVVKNDYKSMFEWQLLDRRKFKYPPFYRLIQIRVKHKDQKIVNLAAADLARRLKIVFGVRILGPEYPLVSRIMNYYLKQILFKIEKDLSSTQMKTKLAKVIEEFYQTKLWGPVRIIIDVDPQ